MKTRVFPIFVAIVAILSITTPAFTQVSGRGGIISPNGNPRSGLFIPALPIDPSSRSPYIDYTLNINLPGLYRIDCVSSNPSTFDPFLRVFRNGAQVAVDDDSGGNLNARVQTILLPGSYTVRVMSARPGSIPLPTPFTLRASSQTIPGGLPTPAIPEGFPIDIPIPQL